MSFVTLLNMGKWIFGVVISIAIVLGIITIVTKQQPPTNSANAPFSTLTAYPTQQPFAINGAPQQQTAGQQPAAGQQQAAPSGQQQQIPYPIPSNYWITTATTATIKTAKGDIVMQLYPQDAPKTVTNFATLAKLGYYNNLTFHRVEPGFVIQGGDPNGNGTGGLSIYGQTFEDELNQNTDSYKEGYKEGVVAMANRGPNTNGSQFFIMLADNDSLPHSYTIFGKVTSGMDVVKQIVIGDKMLTITPQ